jgi:hypothetical protein
VIQKPGIDGGHADADFNSIKYIIAFKCLRTKGDQGTMLPTSDCANPTALF